MNPNLFWFNDEQWSKIVPHLPTNQPGPERKDDHRILSGIMYVLRCGCPWKNCPSEYGPHKTIYNRFARWSEAGKWQRIFAAVAGDPEISGQMALDSSHVKTHRCASGGKGGPRRRRSASPKADTTARFMHLSTNSAGHGRSC